MIKNNIKIYYKCEDISSIKLKPGSVLENISPTEWEESNRYVARTLKGIIVQNVIIKCYCSTSGKKFIATLPEIQIYSKYILDFDKNLVIYAGKIKYVISKTNLYKRL